MLDAFQWLKHNNLLYRNVVVDYAILSDEMVYVPLIAWRDEGIDDCLIDEDISKKRESIYRRKEYGHAKISHFNTSTVPQCLESPNSSQLGHLYGVHAVRKGGTLLTFRRTEDFENQCSLVDNKTRTGILGSCLYTDINKHLRNIQPRSLCMQ